MNIGIFYESEEWSNYELKRVLEGFGENVEMINITEVENVDEIDMNGMDFAVNRIFPSGLQRGIVLSTDRGFNIVGRLRKCGIRAVNPHESFKYDFSKLLTYEKLEKEGVMVPVEYGRIDERGKMLVNENFGYPLLMKPDCGGRSQNTYIIRDEESFRETVKKLPEVEFIIQEYIEPVKGYLTRVEMVGGLAMVVLKRTVGRDGLSSYHSGSRYFMYNDCREEILSVSRKSLDALNIEMGSLDIIEKENGDCIVIDVNSTSNFSQDNIEFLGFNPMEKMAEYIYGRIKEERAKNKNSNQGEFI